MRESSPLKSHEGFKMAAAAPPIDPAMAMAAMMAQLIAQNNAIQNQQVLLQQLIGNSTSSSKKPEECPEGKAAFKPWSLTFQAFLASKSMDWALEMLDTAMEAHPNYPADTLPGPNQALEQAEIDMNRSNKILPWIQ